ncbi:uncharacterized protein LOC122756921 [Drosophila mojavensis]|uniref:uncharacterized protein LOC122756921 n=1 Tax=Drosophila mojavensis TaxID=7230 RepID=UPI001CD1150C|nr:uncharacterized protein LOC122756921 [Drosophila mojavensis]
MIAQYIEDHQSSWDELLHEITLAVNSSVADSTGFTPAFLMIGRKPRLPVVLYDEVTSGSATREIKPEAKEGRMKEVFDIVRSNLQRTSKDQGRHYNLRRRDWWSCYDSINCRTRQKDLRRNWYPNLTVLTRSSSSSPPW